MRFGTHRGFTMIEVIAVLIVLAITAVVAVSGISSLSASDMRVELDTLKSHLRYAQARAIGTDSHWGIQIFSPSVYWLFESNSSNKRLLPALDTDTVTLASLSISGSPLTLDFDGRGSPGISDVIINTSAGSITISANTGFIP